MDRKKRGKREESGLLLYLEVNQTCAKKNFNGKDPILLGDKKERDNKN